MWPTVFRNHADAAHGHSQFSTPDVLTFEAKDAEGRPLGLLYLDCFVRKGANAAARGARACADSCAGEREVLPLVRPSAATSRVRPKAG